MARLALLLLVAAAGATASAVAQDGPRRAGRVCEAVPGADRIVAVGEHGELRLAAGGTVKLSGIRFSAEPAERRRAVDRLREAAGHEAQTAALGEPDRWGRTPAIVVVSRETSVDLARDLVAAGLALVDPGEADQLCRTDLLPFETRAREAGLGLWSGEPERPVAAGDLERLGQRAGRFTLVEGRVRSVGERARRTYLNFGPDWGSDFTVTIPQRTWDTMRHRGMSARALRGRRIRVRGIVEAWQGPAITLAAAELLEVVDGASAPRR